MSWQEFLPLHVATFEYVIMWYVHTSTYFKVPMTFIFLRRNVRDFVHTIAVNKTEVVKEMCSVILRHIS